MILLLLNTKSKHIFPIDSIVLLQESSDTILRFDYWSYYVYYENIRFANTG
jgi:predicted nucleotide-binding protein (sugar kinase/HSP70/actin superfamily)